MSLLSAVVGVVVRGEVGKLEICRLHRFCLSWGPTAHEPKFALPTQEVNEKLSGVATRMDRKTSLGMPKLGSLDDRFPMGGNTLPQLGAHKF